MQIRVQEILCSEKEIGFLNKGKSALLVPVLGKQPDCALKKEVVELNR